MGCLRGSKFTCILFRSRVRKTGFSCESAAWLDVREPVFDERSRLPIAATLRTAACDAGSRNVP